MKKNTKYNKPKEVKISHFNMICAVVGYTHTHSKMQVLKIELLVFDFRFHLHLSLFCSKKSLINFSGSKSMSFYYFDHNQCTHLPATITILLLFIRVRYWRRWRRRTKSKSHSYPSHILLVSLTERTDEIIIYLDLEEEGGGGQKNNSD